MAADSLVATVVWDDGDTESMGCKVPLSGPTSNIHPGITCDRSGMNPIVGIRYCLRARNYDLCEAEYNKLSETEKGEYEAIKPIGGALWRPSTQSDMPLLLRHVAQKLSPKTLFSGPSAVNVEAPARDDKPQGIFNMLLSTKGLLNKQLVKGLTGSQTLIFSTQVGDGGESRCIPRFLDLYALPNASGGVASMFVCCGLATPIDLVTNTLDASKSFLLGLQVKFIPLSLIVELFPVTRFSRLPDYPVNRCISRIIS